VSILGGLSPAPRIFRGAPYAAGKRRRRALRAGPPSRYRLHVLASTTVGRILCSLAEGYGLSLDDVLERYGVSRRLLDDPDALVPGQLDMDLFDELSARAGEPALGIRLAMLPAPLTFDLVDYVGRNSPDLGSACRTLIRYQRLLFDNVAVEMHIEGQVARVVHNVPPGMRFSRHATEYTLGTMLVRARAFSGIDLNPLSVSLRDPPPADDGPYRQLFRVDVAFGQPRTEAVVDRAILSYPNLAADPALYAILERCASERVAKLESCSSLLDEVRREVGRLLRGEVPLAAQVARRLGMSARNLHRRLHDEGCTYQQVVDEVRLAMADAYLADRRIKAVEVGFLLGFSDPSAFYRAFRRWTGKTPVEYRESGMTSTGAAGVGATRAG
jgi:AraC-like DNA-binding protein